MTRHRIRNTRPEVHRLDLERVVAIFIPQKYEVVLISTTATCVVSFDELETELKKLKENRSAMS